MLDFSTEELDNNNLHQIVGKATNETEDNDLQTILHTHMTGFNQSGGHFHFDYYNLMPYISYLHPNVSFYIYSVGHDKRRNNKTYEEETLIFTVKTTQIYTYEDSFDQVQINTHVGFKEPVCISQNSKSVFIIYYMNSGHYCGLKLSPKYHSKENSTKWTGLNNKVDDDEEEKEEEEDDDDDDDEGEEGGETGEDEEKEVQEESKEKSLILNIQNN